METALFNNHQSQINHPRFLQEQQPSALKIVDKLSQYGTQLIEQTEQLVVGPAPNQSAAANGEDFEETPLILDGIPPTYLDV